MQPQSRLCSASPCPRSSSHFANLPSGPTARRRCHGRRGRGAGDCGADPRAAGAAGMVELTPINLNQRRVLIVDDDGNTIALLKRFLEECGAIVESATTARGALERLKSWVPDIVVSDFVMPDDGKHLAARAKEDTAVLVEGGVAASLAGRCSR